MTKPKQRKPTTEDILQDILIVQLGLAGVPQLQIRKILGVDIHRVSRIVRHLKKPKS